MFSHQVMFDSLQLHGLCPWDFLGNNTGVGCRFLLQGILSDQGIKPMSPA